MVTVEELVNNYKIPIEAARVLAPSGMLYDPVRATELYVLASSKGVSDFDPAVLATAIRNHGFNITANEKRFLAARGILEQLLYSREHPVIAVRKIDVTKRYR